MSQITRDFLSLNDINRDEARHILEVSRFLKTGPRDTQHSLLRGRSVAIVLEKPSTRTRVSFELGITQLGAYPVVLLSEGSQLGRGEPIRDTARVLARYCDAIVFRTTTTARLNEMAGCGVPVLNALSDDGHPVQVLSDVFTIEEAFAESGKNGAIEGRTIAFVGDGSSNMARSWVRAAKLFGFRLRIGAPEGYAPPADEVAASGGLVTVYNDPVRAVEGAEVVNTDVWTSMGQEVETGLRLSAFDGWTVNEALMAKAGPGAIVLHCLPAHRGEEIDAATLEGPRSRVWVQAENRLHVQKGLLCWCLGVAHNVRG